MVLEIGSNWSYSFYFVGCCFQDLFNIAHNILMQFSSSFIYIHSYTSWLTVVKSNLKAAFSIATILKWRAGCYPYPWIVPFNFGLYFIMSSVKQERCQVPFFESLVWCKLELKTTDKIDSLLLTILCFLDHQAMEEA